MYKKLMLLISIVALLAFVSVARAEEYEWDAGGDGCSWDDPANWDPDGVPGAGDIALVMDPDPNYDVQYLCPYVDVPVTVEEFGGPAYEQSEDVNHVMTIDGVTFTITSSSTEDNWRRDGDFGDEDPDTSYWEVRIINGGRLEIPFGGARLFDHGKGRLSLADDSSFYVNGEFRAADEDDGYMYMVATGTSDINIAQDLFFGDDGGGCFDFGGNSTITVGKHFFIPGRKDEVLGLKSQINIRDSAVVNAVGVGVHADEEGEVTMNVYGGTINAGFLRAGCEVCKEESPEGDGDIFVYDGVVNISGDISIPDSEDTTATLTQEGGTISCCTLIVKEKGRVDLMGGTLEITCAGSIECDGGIVNIEGGTLVLPGNACAEVAALEEAGCVGGHYAEAGACKGFRGILICDYDSMSDTTTVTATVGDLDKAWSPDPKDGEGEQVVGVVVCWCAGDSIGTKGHAVYFGTSYDDVNDAGMGDPPYRGTKPPLSPQCYDPPETLSLWTPYFWRIDEINTDASITKGDVWTFTTGCEMLPGDINLDCLVNFEDYAMMADDWGVEIWFPDDL
jgi:hypothetical protein